MDRLNRHNISESEKEKVKSIILEGEILTKGLEEFSNDEELAKSLRFKLNQGSPGKNHQNCNLLHTIMHPS